MGSGVWTSSCFSDYATTKGIKTTTTARGVTVDASYKNQDLFVASHMDKMLKPRHVMRECCDSTEHPNTVPVILALDVTGSMGSAATEVAKQLNIVMTELFKKVKDVQFCIMGIGDLAYDAAPIQISQFESDIRIAEQLDKVYFEFGGGGNVFESYTAAWYMGARHTKLDCWKRNKKGIIITMGDEFLNPHLPKYGLEVHVGDEVQETIETNELYQEVKELYDIYHINVEHRFSSFFAPERIKESFIDCIDEENFYSVSLNEIVDTIIDIIIKHEENENENESPYVISADFSNEISW